MEIGTHCTFTSCHRLDFLPFICDNCHQLFCKDHRTPDSHACECVPTHHTQPDDKALPTTTSQQQQLLFTCSLESCKRREVVEVKCPHCEQTYCLQHRHQQDHSCKVLSKEEEPERGALMAKIEPLRSQLGTTTKSTKPNARKGTKSESTRAKVALMKLKMKAEGLDSTPQSERVYYDVQLPRECGIPNKPMFFSKEWSVGRIVDFVAERLKLRNENNRPGAQRLLLHSPSGDPLVMSTALHTLLDTLPSGSGVILEYEGQVLHE